MTSLVNPFIDLPLVFKNIVFIDINSNNIHDKVEKLINTEVINPFDKIIKCLYLINLKSLKSQKYALELAIEIVSKNSKLKYFLKRLPIDLEYKCFEEIVKNIKVVNIKNIEENIESVNHVLMKLDRDNNIRRSFVEKIVNTIVDVNVEYSLRKYCCFLIIRCGYPIEKKFGQQQLDLLLLKYFLDQDNNITVDQEDKLPEQIIVWNELNTKLSYLGLGIIERVIKQYFSENNREALLNEFIDILEIDNEYKMKNNKYIKEWFGLNHNQS